MLGLVKMVIGRAPKSPFNGKYADNGRQSMVNRINIWCCVLHDVSERSGVQASGHKGYVMIHYIGM